MQRTILILSLLLLTMLGIVPERHYAQEQCPLADAVDYPFDRETSQLVQGYSVPSYRHHGRYHTGEDWIVAEGLGAPVYAIANGRVTYSYPLGWGRDGGVVIIEHTFADGTVVYSQYGHMMETDTITFPLRFTCVEQGQIIGAVGSARPAPHVHFEIRLSGSDTPGPGYSWTLPDNEGWRNPSRFVESRRLMNTSSFEWILQTVSTSGFRSAPLMLGDNSLLYLDGNSLRRATHDGRVLWRVNLTRPALMVFGYQAQPYLLLADGTVQALDFDGQVTDSWSLDLADGETLSITDDPFTFTTSMGDMLRLSNDRREILWRNELHTRVAHVANTGLLSGIMGIDRSFAVLNGVGNPQDNAQFRAHADATAGLNGELVVLSKGGLWRVSDAGEWSLLAPDIRAWNTSATLTRADDGTYYVYDGLNLHALPSRFLEGDWQLESPRWTTALNLSGKVQMSLFDTTLLLLSDSGRAIGVNAGGNACFNVQLAGRPSARTWAERGTDNHLRLLIHDQITALDWAELSRTC